MEWEKVWVKVWAVAEEEEDKKVIIFYIPLGKGDIEVLKQETTSYSSVHSMRNVKSDNNEITKGRVRV